jgi:hypothetical protein
MIISIHIRKTAGTSFRRELSEAFGDALLLDYGDEIGSDRLLSRLKRIKTSLSAHYNRNRIVDRYKIVHGHFYGTKYKSLPGRKYYVTFLRDPVERVISNYFYIKSNPSRSHPDAISIHRRNLSLEEYVESAESRNLQARFLAGLDLDRFQFVGITEHYNRSISLFNKLFGVNLRGDVHQNVTRARPSIDMIDPLLRKRIITLNERDVALYAEGVDHFRRMLRRYGLH